MARFTRFSLIALLLVSLVFVGCSDDSDDASGPTSDDIVGTWDLSQLRIDGQLVGNAAETIKFNSDGTGVLEKATGNTNFNWSFSDGRLVVDFPSTDDWNAEVTVDGSEMMLIYNQSSHDYVRKYRK